VETLAKEEYSFASWAQRSLHSDSSSRAVAEKKLSQTRWLEAVRSKKFMFTQKDEDSLNAAWITGDVWPPALGSKVGMKLLMEADILDLLLVLLATISSTTQQKQGPQEGGMVESQDWWNCCQEGNKKGNRRKCGV
jgi:hypothetical protein